jgi:hypothetical protein
MASSAILRGGFQICDAAGASMTASAVQRNVFPGQLECNVAMVESVTVTVDPIVASQAVIAICSQVCLHEISLNLLVAGGADGLVEFDIAIYVTGLANKCRTVRLFLMGGERIPERIV